MKKPLSVRTKVEAGMVVLLMLLVGFNSIPAEPQRYGEDSDGKIWMGFREQTQFGSTADFVVGRNTSLNYYWAVNGTNGNVQFTTGDDFAGLMNDVLDEIYNRSTGTNRGGVIHIQSGTYLCKDPIILKPGICIEGTTGIKHTTEPGVSIHSYVSEGEAYTFTYDGNNFGDPADGVTIRNIKFGEYSGNTKAFIHIKRGMNCLIEDCTLGLTSGSGYVNHSILFEGTHTSTIRDCIIQHGTKTGINLSTTSDGGYLPCNAVRIENCDIHTNYNDGIYIDDGATNVLISGCVIEGNSGWGINNGFIGDGNYVGGNSLTVRDCYFEKNEYGDILVWNAHNNLIDGCYFNAENEYGIIQASVNFSSNSNFDYYHYDNAIRNCWFLTDADNTRPINISGNGSIVDNCAVYTINVRRGSNITIMNCNVTDDINLNNGSTYNAFLFNNKIGGTVHNYGTDTVLLNNRGIAFGQIVFNDNVNISANAVNVYPYIYLANAGDITLDSEADVYFKDNNEQMFKYELSGDDSILYGGSAITDDLYFYCNSNVDTTNNPWIIMNGGASIQYNINEGNEHFFKADASNFLSLWKTGSIAQIKGYMELELTTTSSNIVLDPATDVVIVENILNLNPVSTLGDYAPSEGDVYYNDTNNDFEGWNGSAWNGFGGEGIFAQLSSSVDQTFAITGVGYNVTFNSNDGINGISHSESVEPQNITIVTTGVYSIMVQPQVHASGGASGAFHMWLRCDTGSGFFDVPNTNVELVLANNDEDVIPLIMVMHFNAGDIIRINASVAHTGIELDAQTPAGEPAIPSIIFSMYKI